MRASLLAFLGAAFWLHPTPGRADVVVSTSLDLTQLQILPSIGTVEFLLPWAAQVFAQAQDSLGGFDQHFNSVMDTATSASASTTLATASGTASFPALSASATIGAHLPNIAVFASSSSNGSFPGSLSGSIEIVGTTGPVTAQFKAPLSIDQSLSMNGGAFPPVPRRFSTSFRRILMAEVPSCSLTIRCRLARAVLHRSRGAPR